MTKSLIAGASASLHARQVRLQEAERDRAARAFHSAMLGLLLQFTPHEREVLCSIEPTQQRGGMLTPEQATLDARWHALDAARAGNGATVHQLCDRCEVMMGAEEMVRRVKVLTIEYNQQK